jgi:hypothetical protein
MPSRGTSRSTTNTTCAPSRGARTSSRCRLRRCGCRRIRLDIGTTSGSLQRGRILARRRRCRNERVHCGPVEPVGWGQNPSGGGRQDAAVAERSINRPRIMHGGRRRDGRSPANVVHRRIGDVASRPHCPAQAGSGVDGRIGVDREADGHAMLARRATAPPAGSRSDGDRTDLPCSRSASLRHGRSTPRASVCWAPRQRRRRCRRE